MTSGPPLTPPPPPPPPPASPSTQIRWAPPLEDAGAAVRSGWGRASIAAILVLVVVLILNVLLAWLQTEAARRIIAVTGESVAVPAGPGIAKAALLSHMTWHGVSFDVEVPLAQNELSPFGGSFAVSVTFAIMLGLAITGYLLFRAGRWIAERTPVDGWLSGIRGLQIAVVYGIAMFVLGLFAGIDIAASDVVPTGQGADELSIRPSVIGSFGMPFLLALFAAGAGALRGKLNPVAAPARMTLAAVAGGWRAAWLAVALSSVGFLIVAALHPDATRAFLELIPGGGLSRALVVVGVFLVLPNIGTGIAAASMGGSINATSFTALGDSCALVSYLQFPSGMSDAFGAGPTPMSCGIPLELGTAPLPYFLFLLVPLAATIAGGRFAAQRAGAVGRREGAVAGLTVALPYALWLWLLGLVARAGYSAQTGFFDLNIWLGPGLLSTVLIALVWGAAGGAIGGALGAGNAGGPGIDPGPPANVSG